MAISEEGAIREAAAAFFSARSPLTRTAEVGWRETISEMAEMDFFGQALPEEAGGLGLPLVASGWIAEAAGFELISGPWLDQLIAVQLCAGRPELAASFASGQLTAAIGIAKPESAHYDSQSGTVTGSVSRVRFGGEVDRWVLVFDAATVVIDAASLTARRSEHAIDPHWQAVEGHFQELDADLVATHSDGPAAQIALANVLASTMSIGSAKRVLDDAVEYARNRQQFGRPIGTFQALKHRAANAYVAWFHARCCSYAALASDDVLQRSVARVAADRAYRQAAESALQIHGGIGFTSETSVHLFLKNAQQLRAWPDTIERSLQDIGASIGLREVTP